MGDKAEKFALSPESIPQEKPVGPSSPPNGGTLAWLNVLGSFMLYFNTWGIMNTFGAYQTYYESGALFHSSSSDISWVSSIAAFMLLFVGLFVGPIYDRGYLRTLLIVGSLMVAFGHMMLSLCSEFWQVVQYVSKLVSPPILFGFNSNPNAKIYYTILGIDPEYQYSRNITYTVPYVW
ncbi:hypothetical protein N7516_011446 [Penicillium verrucosum]|uniref:uncharacterized protein n=1 Tax=Penicillium verrucosum TaxID=60171 RepID=UPI002545690D|nr:uncharacterized protein N7516_011446 [Penicillium verrucosum]KAJ5920588.1 hypothetical protein N7516_011446 [Penicillium verrucosum]